MGKCETCKYFKVLKFHKAIDANEGDQEGGMCELLKDALCMTNSILWSVEALHVQKSFGCTLHRDNT